MSNVEELREEKECELPVSKKCLDIMKGIDDMSTAEAIAEMYIDAHYEEIISEIENMTGFDELYEQCMEERKKRYEEAKKRLKVIR